MIPLTRRLASVCIGLTVLGGCAPLARMVEPAPARAWPTTLTRAQQSAARGEFETADTTLADFAKRYPSSREALETSYWRAIYELDPSNREQSISAAIASLDRYLADTRYRDHLLEARSLRRVAGQLDAMNRLAANAIAQANDASAAAARAPTDARAEPKSGAPETSPTASDAEIKRLKDELAKANAELERIRRRLAQPPPKERPL